MAGTQGKKGFADGDNQSSLFNGPFGLLFNKYDQTLVVCDYGNDKVRKVSLKDGIKNHSFFI